MPPSVAAAGYSPPVPSTKKTLHSLRSPATKAMAAPPSLVSVRTKGFDGPAVLDDCGGTSQAPTLEQLAGVAWDGNGGGNVVAVSVPTALGGKPSKGPKKRRSFDFATAFRASGSDAPVEPPQQPQPQARGRSDQAHGGSSKARKPRPRSADALATQMMSPEAFAVLEESMQHERGERVRAKQLEALAALEAQARQLHGQQAAEHCGEWEQPQRRRQARGPRRISPLDRSCSSADAALQMMHELLHDEDEEDDEDGAHAARRRSLNDDDGEHEQFHRSDSVLGMLQSELSKPGKKASSKHRGKRSSFYSEGKRPSFHLPKSGPKAASFHYEGGKRSSFHNRAPPPPPPPFERVDSPMPSAVHPSRAPDSLGDLLPDPRGSPVKSDDGYDNKQERAAERDAKEEAGGEKKKEGGKKGGSKRGARKSSPHPVRGFVDPSMRKNRQPSPQEEKAGNNVLFSTYPADMNGPPSKRASTSPVSSASSGSDHGDDDHHDDASLSNETLDPSVCSETMFDVLAEQNAQTSDELRDLIEIMHEEFTKLRVAKVDAETRASTLETDLVSSQQERDAELLRLTEENERWKRAAQKGRVKVEGMSAKVERLEREHAEMATGWGGLAERARAAEERSERLEEENRRLRQMLQRYAGGEEGANVGSPVRETARHGSPPPVQSVAMPSPRHSSFHHRRAPPPQGRQPPQAQSFHTRPAVRRPPQTRPARSPHDAPASWHGGKRVKNLRRVPVLVPPLHVGGGGGGADEGLTRNDGVAAPGPPTRTPVRTTNDPRLRRKSSQSTSSTVRSSLTTARDSTLGDSMDELEALAHLYGTDGPLLSPTDGGGARMASSRSLDGMVAMMEAMMEGEGDSGDEEEYFDADRSEGARSGPAF